MKPTALISIYVAAASSTGSGPEAQNVFGLASFNRGVFKWNP